MIARQKYLQYPQRFNYDPYCWPPDIGLAQLHSTCSQPGIKDPKGITCKCCLNTSKQSINQWWKRNISDDLKRKGTSIAGYFKLLIFYNISIFLIICIYAVYNIYTLNYVCSYIDQQQSCVSGIFLYYLNYNEMIKILTNNSQTQRIQMLKILQTVAFYVLLVCNSFSVFFITFFNKSAKTELIQNINSYRQHILVFYNINKSVLENFENILKDQQSGWAIKIIKKFQLYQIKQYYQLFQQRNKVYYQILSQHTKNKRQKLLNKLNQKLYKTHQQLLTQKLKTNQFSQKAILIFENIQTKQKIHQLFRLGTPYRWYYGLRTLLKHFKIKQFSQQDIKPCSFRILEGSDLYWQNIGETVGVRMASRIKAFFVCFIFIGICYVVLYYPMLFSLNADSAKQSGNLTIFEKFLPELISLFLVAISIGFRLYLNKLSSERNPKDEVQKSRFILIVSTLFHTIFFVLMPFFFLLVPNNISSQSIKLFVISGQGRTFMLLQLIISIIDLPYKLWNSKKVSTLSSQTQAFKYNQQMLHRIVQYPQYPLEARIDVMLRFWSLSILYTFLMPSMLILIFFCLCIIYWLEKFNLYKHYSLRRKVSIRLITQVLTYYVNFFSILLCAIYCLNCQGNYFMIGCAIIATSTGVVFNVIYWLILNRTKKINYRKVSTTKRTTIKEIINQQQNQQQLTLTEYCDSMNSSYLSFIDSIRNDDLDQQINDYIKKMKGENQISQTIELQINKSANSKLNQQGQ